ncbi:transcriptional regulator, AlpA family [Nitrosospira multiformis]|uniref:Transcriptional regulator, AlpA family n=1 Tax=Nitrosospira multiformis TaxID=1231 RepID=A0A1H8J0T9_9PROT|nr:AlpA family phage regulatory protein [Nitrosospira multiformis]SEN73906.1 transcriptional regulator, AlpA family [Nitrosospira multiformis]
MRNKILRGPVVDSSTGERRSTRYARISKGLFPKPIKLGPRSVGWLESEVEAINAARAAGKTDDEIRALVLKLEAARKTLA